MKLSDRAIEVLLAAERQLVTLAHEASGARDYDVATALLEAARRVKMVGGNGELIPVQPAVTDQSDGSNSDSATVSRVTAPKRLRKSAYPKFVKDGESLVKIGWSKAEKSEYEHKSPKKVLLSLGLVLSEIGAKGHRFSMDKVLPLTDSEDSSSLPDYQCYLCLAWMRHCGLVTQHGRQGYSLPKNGDLVTAIERAWQQLPVRR